MGERQRGRVGIRRLRDVEGRRGPRDLRRVEGGRGAEPECDVGADTAAQRRRRLAGEDLGFQRAGMDGFVLRQQAFRIRGRDAFGRHAKCDGDQLTRRRGSEFGFEVRIERQQFGGAVAVSLGHLFDGVAEMHDVLDRNGRERR